MSVSLYAMSAEVVKVPLIGDSDSDDEDEGTPLSDLGISTTSAPKGKDDKAVSFKEDVDVKRFRKDSAITDEEEDYEPEDFDEYYHEPYSVPKPVEPKVGFINRPLLSITVRVIDTVCLALAVILVLNQSKLPLSHFIPNIHIAYKIAIAFVVFRVLWSMVSEFLSKIVKMTRSSKKDKKRRRS